MANIKKYLDSTGLEHFWGILSNKFVVKTDAIGSLSKNVTATKITIIGSDVNGTAKSSVDLPVATSSAAGLLSASDKSVLDSLTANSNYKGIALKDGSSDSIDIAATNKAELTLTYETEGSGDSAVKYIVLKDNAGTAKTRLDVSDFVIDGILSDTDVAVDDAVGTAILSLVFKLADGTTKTETVDLSDLIDVYIGTGGISITNNIVTLNKATDTVLGGIKTGYSASGKNYAVQLDSNSKAYVNVPWTDNNTEYTAGSGDTYVKPVITGTTINVTTTTALTDKFSSITALANTKVASVATVSGETLISASTDSSKNVTLSSTTALKNAVTAANSAIQTATGVTGTNGGITATKNGTAYSLSLDSTTQTNLGKASTAVQTVTIGSGSSVASASVSSGTANFDGDAVASAIGLQILSETEISDICQ